MSDRPVRILLTDGGYKHTLGAVRSLARAGMKVDVIGSVHCLSSWSRYLSGVAYPQELFSEAKFEDFVAFLRSSQYDVLLPIGARSVQLLSKCRERLLESTKLPLAPQEAIELCLDKEETAAYAQKIGIHVPTSWVFTTIDEVKHRIHEITFPVVVKGRSELSKDKPFYAYTAQQLIDGLVKTESLRLANSMPFPIIQQYIDGVGVGFFALYQEGVCKRVFMHQRVRETPASGGASCCAVSIYEEDLLHAGRKILDGLHWHGVVMVEFKRQQQSGKLYLMEVNPKFWGSLDLAIASGVDFPVLATKMALGEEIGYSQDYQVGVKYHWPLDGEIRHLIERPGSLVSILADVINPHVQSNVWIQDIKPAIYSTHLEMRHLAGRLLTKLGLRKVLHRIRSQGVTSAVVRFYTESTGIPLIRYSQITPYLLVGAQHSQAGCRKLDKLGVKGIINMRSEYDDLSHNLVVGEYCHLPVTEFTAPTVKQLFQGVKFIQGVCEQGGSVYVHCREGVSRAPMMAAAYLIYEGMSLDEAVNLIKKTRPFINILPVQIERLEQFANHLQQDGRA